MNVSSTRLPEQCGDGGLLFSIDGEGRFLLTPAMLAQFPFAGVAGNQVIRLNDLFTQDSGEKLDTLLADVRTNQEDGLAQRIVVRDREGRTLTVSLARLAGAAPGRLICSLEERRLLVHEPAHSRRLAAAAGDLPSRADAYRHVTGLAGDIAAIGAGFRIFLVGLNRPRNLRGPVADSIWSRLTERAGMRLQTVVGGRGLVARYSDNAFVVVDAQNSGPLQPEMAAGSIISSFDHPFEVEGVDFYIGVNIGTAEVGASAENIGSYFRCAELAMEDARRSGVTTRECSAEMVDETCARLRLERELRAAFEYGGFEIELQPKIDMAAGGVRGFEALIRWNHPERGVIPPEEFIPVAEESDLLVPVTDWVLHEVCRLLKAERDAGRTPLPISINVPPSQLMHRDVKDFIKVINAYDIPPSLIEFELTESVSTVEITRGISVMSALRAAGINISVEDFGTGYSSLSRLVRLPVTTLKIDRSFVEGLPGDPNACEVVTAITRVAHALDLKVVAEGVENDSQARFLSDHGVTIAQGFLFSHPLPPEKAFRLAELGVG